MRNGENYWTKEKIIEKSLECKTRSEFIKKYSRGYYYAKKLNIYVDICKNFIKLNNDTKRCIYVYEFDDKYVYVGLTNNLKTRKYKHKQEGSVYEYMKINNNYVLKQLSEYLDIDIAIEKEEFYVNEYKKNGWNILNKSKTGSIGSNVVKWTKDKLIEEALKYKTRTEFQKGSKGAYLRAYRIKYLDEICSHMIEKKKPNGYWNNFERCKNIAFKYENKTDFLENNYSAWYYSKKNNWFDEICSHMIEKKKPNGYWEIKDNCFEASKNYKNKTDFKNHSAYEYSRKNDWLDDFF